jgi:hypothetical protein
MISAMKEKWIKWVQHVAHMAKIRITYKISAGKPKGKTTRNI